MITRRPSVACQSAMSSKSAPNSKSNNFKQQRVLFGGERVPVGHQASRWKSPFGRLHSIRVARENQAAPPSSRRKKMFSLRVDPRCKTLSPQLQSELRVPAVSARANQGHGIHLLPANCHAFTPGPRPPLSGPITASARCVSDASPDRRWRVARPREWHRPARLPGMGLLRLRASPRSRLVLG